MAPDDDPRTVDLTHSEAMAAVHGEGRNSAGGPGPSASRDAQVQATRTIGRGRPPGEVVTTAVGDGLWSDGVAPPVLFAPVAVRP